MNLAVLYWKGCWKVLECKFTEIIGDFKEDAMECSGGKFFSVIPAITEIYLGDIISLVIFLNAEQSYSQIEI
ncbi:MAG: hypothetical protein JWO09_2678 [Bacteroidetes bacterium]|nr:hypothetical protein [Bacteroidota bacterium]